MPKMILNVRRIGDPVLRKKAAKVEKITKDTHALIKNLFDTLEQQQGIGLAAPQVGVSQRVAVVVMAPDEAQPENIVKFALINPEVVKRSSVQLIGAEGCLSIPGWRGEVERPDAITVKFMDEAGERRKIDLKGWIARCFMHEIDHLDGVMYIDKLVAPDRIWPVKEGDEEKVEHRSVKK